MSEAGQEKVQIGIWGGTGYGAGELLRLLASHPNVEVATVVSRSMAGKPVSEAHPQLEGFYNFNFDEAMDFEKLAGGTHKVVFTALPHGTSGTTIAGVFAEARKHQVKIIDLSGDLRLENESQRAKYYPEASVSAEVSTAFVFGLPELNREKIKATSFAANPGCYAQTSALAALPLAIKGLLSRISFDGKSGTSGAGKTPSAAFHHPHTNTNAFAYKALSHRHEPEISQALGDPTQSNIALSFVPHVIPTSRGIYSTGHAVLKCESTTAELLTLYRDFYKDHPFVRVRESAPQLSAVLGSNFCDVSVVARGDSAVVFAATDNLIKGMTGTAIQNMNLMCGLSETTGLWTPGLGPI